MGLKKGCVSLENNYELWKKMFEEEKNKLKEIFKDDSFSIEHVGSTSIKGLSAKPIIDIAIGLYSFNELNKYKKDLINYYTIKENFDHDEILLVKENNEETYFLIHVMIKDGTRYKNMIKFKNILNNNPDILKEYEKLKQELLKKYQNDRKIYTQSKNDFIKQTLKKH